MEFKEFMNNENLSESDIVKAARIVNELCRSLSACKLCPLYSGSRCIAVKTSGVSIVGVVEKRMKKLLHPNYMEKVAEMLGVKLGEPFKIAHDYNNIISGFHLEKTGLYCDESLRAPFNLAELLVGDAYIVKEKNKDE